MRPTLTVFTPTFNRAYTLHKCYQSLKQQTCMDFEWLIIDDGSVDHTKELVQSWISEKRIKIRYHYQENKGMHGAHNTAYELINTELNVCIDSDDYMPYDAVDKIIRFWNENGGQQYAGIIGLDATPDGNVIGTKFPADLKVSTLMDIHGKYKINGDKKLVYRSDLTKKTSPYPIFPGEKYCPLSYKYILIDQLCPLLVVNEIFCHVEYLEDGSSMNIINQYKRNPRGFSFFRKVALANTPLLKDRFRESIHYVSSSLMIKNYKFLFESPRFFITLFSIPFGILLYLYLQNTNKATVMKNN